MLKTGSCFFIVGAIIFSSIHVTHATGSADRVQVSSPWVREIPPQANVTAFYMVITNTQKPVKLISVQSDFFARVEIHKTVHKDGVMRMHKQNFVKLPTGKAISFKPKGLHVMLFGPKSSFKAKDELVFKLIFSDGSEQMITAMVKAK